MKRHFVYFRYVVMHKLFVFLAGRKLGVSLIQLITHDWSKFSPMEWLPYARTFYNKDGSKKAYEETIEFALAWKHHQHHQPHHWQYWCNVDGAPIFLTNVMIWDDGRIEGFVGRESPFGGSYLELCAVPRERVSADPMPEKYIREMVADWVGAGRAITGKVDVIGWYNRTKDTKILHPDTRKRVEELIQEFKPAPQPFN